MKTKRMMALLLVLLTVFTAACTAKPEKSGDNTGTTAESRGGSETSAEAGAETAAETEITLTAAEKYRDVDFNGLTVTIRIPEKSITYMSIPLYTVSVPAASESCFPASRSKCRNSISTSTVRDGSSAM